MENYDYEYISELEKIDEMYMEMSEDDIFQKLDQLLKKAINDGKTEWKLFILSEKCHYQRNYADSLTYTLNAIAMAPQNYYFLSSLATTYYSLEDYDNAIVCYNNAIKANEKCYRAYIDRASVYRRIRNYSMAIKDAEYVIKHATDDRMIAIAKHSLSRSYILSGKPEEAKEILLNLKDCLYDSSEYYEALAASYETLEEYSTALKYYKKARDICKDQILISLLDAKIRIYEKRENSEILDPVQEMLANLNIVSEEDTLLMKILYEHSDQKTVMKEEYRSFLYNLNCKGS